MTSGKEHTQTSLSKYLLTMNLVSSATVPPGEGTDINNYTVSVPKRVMPDGSCHTPGPAW